MYIHIRVGRVGQEAYQTSAQPILYIYICMYVYVCMSIYMYIIYISDERAANPQ